jgi:hypothetical protein
MVAGQQYSLSFLLAEIGLVAVALGCGRLLLFPPGISIETEALCFLVAMVAGCGALGGLFLRMAIGLIVGSVLAVASVPLLIMTIMSAAA